MSQMSHSNIKQLIEMSHVQEVAIELQEDQCLHFGVADSSDAKCFNLSKICISSSTVTCNVFEESLMLGGRKRSRTQKYYKSVV